MPFNITHNTQGHMFPQLYRRLKDLAGPSGPFWSSCPTMALPSLSDLSAEQLRVIVAEGHQLLRMREAPTGLAQPITPPGGPRAGPNDPPPAPPAPAEDDKGPWVRHDAPLGPAQAPAALLQFRGASDLQVAASVSYSASLSSAA